MNTDQLTETVRVIPIDNIPASLTGHALVEIMGHDRIAGTICLQSFGPQMFLQVTTPDLPEEAPKTWRHRRYGQDGEYKQDGVSAERGYTKLFPYHSLFSITLCTEETALNAALANRNRPLEHFVPDDRENPPATPGTDPFPDDDDNEEERY